MTRRDQCYLVGRRASFLVGAQAATAWSALAQRLEAMSEMDIPKFRDLLTAIRTATIVARRKPS
jgi:hypothetical protein